MRARRSAALALAAAALALACAGLRAQQAPEASEEERRAYAEAVATLVDDPAKSERELEQFLASYPASPLADDAGMRLAEIAAKRGDGDAALARLQEVVRSHPQGDRVDAARIEIARLELARGQPEAAAASLRSVRISKLSSAEQETAFDLQAAAASDPAEKLRWMARARAVETDPAAVARADAEIDAQIAQMGPADLLSAADQMGREIPAARTLLRAADLALDSGDVETAHRAVDQASKLPLAPAYQARLAAVSERLRLREEGPRNAANLPRFSDVANLDTPDTSAAAGTLGVVLPLTGKFSHFGELSLQGVLLATGVFGADGPAPHVRVLVRDSAGRPERAAQAVRELADEGVVAIVGPLVAGECEAAAAAAEQAGVPLVTLTARTEVTQGRTQVFRVRTTPQEEVDALVGNAVHAAGAQRFALLYPRDAYGRGLRRLFWQAAEQQGGRVVAVASYDPDDTDFGDAIRRLVGYTLLTDGEKQALKKRADMERRARRLPMEEAAAQREEARAMTGPDGEALPPIVDYDALFIPEAYDKVVLIAPQLAYHEAGGAMLLGPSGWYHPDLLRIGREHVEGARIVAQFEAESSLPFVRSFEQGFQRAYGDAPDVFSAQGFDAANLVLVQLAHGRDSRSAVREGLLGVRGYPGVTGILTMGADGNAHKRPFLLAVQHGHFVPLD